MGVRSFLMFFIALALIRFGGMRIFGKKIAFDYIIIMLGAILARGGVGRRLFLSAVAAVVVMVIIHKVLALLSILCDCGGRQSRQGNPSNTVQGW